MRIYVAGVGMTPFGKSPRSLVNLLVEAGRQALADAGEPEVDAIYLGAMNPEAFTGEGNFAVVVADALGLAGVPAIRVETASSTGATAYHQACLAIASGHVSRVLVVAGEKMTHLPTARTTAILAEVIDHDERGCGATMPALAALVTRCYMGRHGIDAATMTRVLASVALKNHGNGALNPRAQFRKPISEAQYLESKPISTPLRLFDCAPITDGAAAVLLSAEPIPGPDGRERTPIRVVGLGQATDTIALRHRTNLTGFKSTRVAATRAYAMAGVRPCDVSFAEIHDAFTPFEVIGTEDLGFVPDGAGGQAVLDGVTALRGRLPVNPSGGLKARGHPIGASGLAQVVEAVWQLRGDAGAPRQLESPSVALVQSIGGLANNNLVSILDRADRHRVHAAPAPPLSIEESPVRRGEPKAGATGRLESFTELHVAPEGVKAPLVLGLVRTADGMRVLARGATGDRLAIGAAVVLRREKYRYQFEQTTPIGRLGTRLGSALAVVTRPIRVRARWLRRRAARRATS